MELLVSVLVLMIGTLATLSLVGSSSASLSKTKAREGAVNLSRELLESAHDMPFAQIGDPNWFRQTLEDTPGRTGGVSAGTDGAQRTVVERRGVDYAVAVNSCSVDDASDGYGAHVTESHAWCADSTTAGSEDSQAHDFKRVTTTINWSFHDKAQPALVQTATFAASGAVVGPSVTDLSITAPSGLSPTEPVITDPGTTTVTFVGTSVGANDMRFSVDGGEQTTGVTNQGNGTWRFVWDISEFTDGVYMITAAAVDGLGIRGPARTLQVKLARGVPVAPQNVTGDYNYVYASGARTLAVELDWDANAEGNVTGYEVLKGSTTVCAASLAISCIDLSPAANGSTTYTVRTLYKDGAGNPGAVSTTYGVTAPTQVSPSFVKHIAQSSCGSTSNAMTVPTGGVAAGNTVIVRLGLRGGTSGTVSASDSRGNTYTIDRDVVGTHTRSVIFSAHVGTALSAGNTITVSHPSADSSGVVAGEFADIASSSRVDGSGGGTGNSNSPSATVTTSTARDLVYGAFANQNVRSVTEAAGWTTHSYQAPACGGASKESTNHGAYLIAPTTGSYTYNPTISSAERWTAAVVAYKPSGRATLPQPGRPTDLSIAVNGDGTRTLTWTAPSGTPAVEFYRIYRDGRDYTERVDTAGATGSTVTWTDTNSGGTSHSYRVTAVSATLVESDFAGPVSG